MATDIEFRERVKSILNSTHEQLVSARGSYGESWVSRGGVGAFMNLARKWDRITRASEQKDWNILKALDDDKRQEGLIDDLRDLRDYIVLVDEYWSRDKQGVEQYVKEAGTTRDDDPTHPQEYNVIVEVVDHGDGRVDLIVPVKSSTRQINLVQVPNDKEGV